MLGAILVIAVAWFIIVLIIDRTPYAELTERQEEKMFARWADEDYTDYKKKRDEETKERVREKIKLYYDKLLVCFRKK